MANWWDSAPLADQVQSDKWWESAPLQQAQPETVSRSAQQWADQESLPIPGTEWNTPEPSYQPSSVPFLDPISTFANDAVSSIPVAGPFLEGAGNQVDAWINNALGFEAQTAEDRAAIDAANSQRFPLAAGTGSVVGASAPLMALGATGVGGTLLGNTGSMVQRSLMGGIGGAGIAGADAVVRGDDIDDIRMQMLLGAGVGTVLPGGERAVTSIARSLMGMNPSAATRSVAQTLENSNINPADVPRMMDELGPDAMMLDLSRNTQRQAGGIASVPGQGSTTLDDALLLRNEGTNMRIQGDVDSILGEAPIPSRLAAEIGDNQRGLSPLYKDALETAQAVDTRAIADNLDSMIVNERGAAQSALQSLRRDLNVIDTDTLDPNPQTLLNIRQKIDGILYTDGQMSPLDSNVSRVLRDARRQIDGELAAKVPGIKDIDRQFAELSSQKGAVDTGQSILSSGRNEVIRPAELVDMITGGRSEIVGPSGVPFRLSQGARAEIDRIIGTTGNDVSALKQALKGDGSWNREKLNTLFGQERADQLVDLLEREQRYSGSFQRITQNSETAARTAAQREAMPNQINLDIQKLLFAVPEAMANAGARSRSQSVNAQIAEMLTNRPSPELVDQLIAARRANRGVLGAAGVPVFTGNE